MRTHWRTLIALLGLIAYTYVMWMVFLRNSPQQNDIQPNRNGNGNGNGKDQVLSSPPTLAKLPPPCPPPTRVPCPSMSGNSKDAVPPAPSHPDLNDEGKFVNPFFNPNPKHKYASVPQSKHPRSPAANQRLWWSSGCARMECSWNDTICDTTDPTDYTSNSLCCVHLLRDALRVFSGVMEELNIDYYVAFGALIGPARSDRLVPWTIDLDFVVDKNDISSILNNENSKRDILARNGLSFFADLFPRICINNYFMDGLLEKKFLSTERSQYYPLYFPYGDIFHSIPMTVPNPYGPEREVHRTLACHFPPERVFPTVLTPIYGGTLSVRFPQDHDYWLTKVYGNWRVPDSGKKQHGNTKCKDDDKPSAWQ